MLLPPAPSSMPLSPPAPHAPRALLLAVVLGAMTGVGAQTSQAQGNPSAAAWAIGDQVRSAVRMGIDPKPQTLTVEIPAAPASGARGLAPQRSAQAQPVAPAPAPRPLNLDPLPPVHTPPGGIANPAQQREALRARALAQAAQSAPSTPAPPPVPAPPPAPPPAVVRNAAVSHQGTAPLWAYDGIYGPQAWGQMHPDWSQCSRGQRQSPLSIDDGNALHGPAETIAVRYRPGTASVLHTGRTLQVDVQGDNSIGVRNATFRLQQIQFHHPAEERINGQSFAMSADLVHRSPDGQIAVLVVLLEPGDASPVIDRLWTYLPLAVADRVQMPPDSLDLADLLPQDPRYYQYLGSLTTPPCTEGVLRLVMKQPVTISREQLRLFSQLFPNNARPPQPLNGRMVRSAQ